MLGKWLDVPTRILWVTRLIQISIIGSPLTATITVGAICIMPTVPRVLEADGQMCPPYSYMDYATLARILDGRGYVW